MKKTIGRKEYNTETATLIRRFNYGYWGDPAGYQEALYPAGYQEALYRTPDGFFFLYVYGGETSPYPKQDILRLGKAKADEWLENHQ